MRLGALRPPKGSQKTAKRLGQGTGTGTGKTAGRGHKGARARSGASRGSRIGFEGGQMPLHRRLPKIGFTSRSKIDYQVVNVGAIEECGLEGEVGPVELRNVGLIRKQKGLVKILGDGELTKKLSIKAHAFSVSATTKIEQVGGAAQKIEG